MALAMDKDVLFETLAAGRRFSAARNWEKSAPKFGSVPLFTCVVSTVEIGPPAPVSVAVVPVNAVIKGAFTKAKFSTMPITKARFTSLRST